MAKELRRSGAGYHNNPVYDPAYQARRERDRAKFFQEQERRRANPEAFKWKDRRGYACGFIVLIVLLAPVALLVYAVFRFF